MTWFVKCDVVKMPTEYHHSYQSALESIRAKCGDGYYLDVEFENTEEFVKWMNEDFLNPYDHGHYCKIHRVDNDAYWSKYLRPLGAEIMYALEKGINDGSYCSYDNYAQYIDADCRFVSFDDKEEYFASIMPLKDILEELKCRY